jgi:hypothetical protein
MFIELSLAKICLGTAGYSIGMKMKEYDSATENNCEAQLRTDECLSSADRA